MNFNYTNQIGEQGEQKLQINGRGLILYKGFTCGTFDLLHAGHVFLLKHAKSKCTRLIVGLQVDPTIDRPEKNKPIQSLYERHIQLEACRYVDEIIVYETEKDLELICKTVDFNVRFLGDEYQDKNFTGKDILLKKDPCFRFEYVDRSHGFSSSELRSRIVNNHQINLIEQIKHFDYQPLSSFDNDNMNSQFNNLTSLTTTPLPIDHYQLNPLSQEQINKLLDPLGVTRTNI